MEEAAVGSDAAVAGFVGVVVVEDVAAFAAADVAAAHGFVAHAAVHVAVASVVVGAVAAAFVAAAGTAELDAPAAFVGASVAFAGKKM